MSNLILDPVLDPDFQNELTQMAVQHYRESLRLLLTNLYPRGYTTGQVDPAKEDKMERLQSLMQDHERNVAVVMDPTALPGDAARANQGLVEEEKLREEVFGA